MVQVRKGNQILRMQFRRNAKAAIGRKRYMEAVRNAVQRNSFGHHRARRVNDRNLRLRRGAMRCRIRIDMRNVEAAAIGRWRNVACAASCSKPLLFCACLGIENGHVVGDSISDKQVLAIAVLNDARRLCGDRPRGCHLQGLRIDH